MNSFFLDRLGKAEGIVAVNIFIFSTLCLLSACRVISEPTFVSCFTTWVGLFMGGTTVAAFRDWKKGNGNGNGNPPNQPHS